MIACRHGVPYSERCFKCVPDFAKDLADAAKAVRRDEQRVLAIVLANCTDAQRAELFAPYNHETGERK